MELTETQYRYLEGAIGRYRLTISEKYKIWNDNDFDRAMAVRDQLSINDPLTKFCKYCGIEYSVSIFGKLDELMKQYESTHIQA